MLTSFSKSKEGSKWNGPSRKSEQIEREKERGKGRRRRGEKYRCGSSIRNRPLFVKIESNAWKNSVMMTYFAIFFCRCRDMFRELAEIFCGLVMSLCVFFNLLTLTPNLAAFLGTKPIFIRIGLAYFFQFLRSSINALSEWGCYLSSRWQGIKFNIRCSPLSLSFFASIYHSTYIYTLCTQLFSCTVFLVVIVVFLCSSFSCADLLLRTFFFWKKKIIYFASVVRNLFYQFCALGRWISCD